jgi:pimeloyl-ACP methyl ester carboxylesterase
VGRGYGSAVERIDVEFSSAGDRCAAWLYVPSADPTDAPGTPRACVVMAHGLSLTRHDGLPRIAEAYAAAGFAVLVFDHRFLGDSGGEPRQRFRVAEQVEDWRGAIRLARSRPEVDPDRIVLWGYSFSGGHVVRLAAEDDRVAAALVLSPFIDGLQRAVRTRPTTLGWLVAQAAADRLGRHRTVPVCGPVGSRALLPFPGEADGFAAVTEGNPRWRNELSPGEFLTIPLYRPLRLARRIACPLWVGLDERDITVHGPSVERLARTAPDSELHRYPYDHWQPFLGDAPDRITADQLAFLAARGLPG